MKGLIHSFESFGTKDGPGIRFVIFMQGCPLRCLYCHNPDTWNANDASIELSASELFQEINKVKGFIKNGGVTVSGGEPLLQAKFILELFKLCKAENIHTTIDTSGYVLNDTVKEVLSYTDLVLLDIKHINPEKYKTLTSQPLKPTLDFLSYLSDINKPVWVRYVLVPGYSDDEQDLKEWAQYVSTFNIIKRVDILPFHQMGIHKWQKVNAEYKLSDVRAASDDDVNRAEKIFREYEIESI